MQELHQYEITLTNAISVNSPELRWNIFYDMVQKICSDILEHGRSPFYERCLSCYRIGITPSGQKLSPGWFSRNALNIVFAVYYLLQKNPPHLLKDTMFRTLGPLNNILRDNPAMQDLRYTRLFREAQNFYDDRLRLVFAAEEARVSANKTPAPAAEGTTESSAQTTEAQAASTEEAASVPASADVEPAGAEPADTESVCSIPSLLLPLLAENQTALNDAIRAQKQLNGEIAKALSSIGNPFSQGAAFQRQTLSGFGSLLTHLEECNRILLSNLSAMETALSTAQWEGFVEIAALLDAFSERHSDPEQRRAGAMWGDIRAIRQRYANLLHRQGIEAITPAPGDAFDEDLHELSDDADIDLDDAARITKLHTRGYRMNDTIFLRAVVDADDETPDR